MSLLNNKKIVITGGAGFIGTHLATELKKSNQITVLDHRVGPVPGVNYLTGDYHRLALQHILKGQDIIFHLAWSTTPALKSTSRQEQDLNILPTALLIKQVMTSSINHLVFVSSAGPVYGNAPTPFRETDSPRPVNTYGDSKLQVEHMLRKIASNHLRITVFRPTNIIGSSQQLHHHQGIIPALAQAHLNQKPFYMWGNASKDYIAVSDAVHALSSINHQSSFYDIFNLGSGTLVSTQQLISLAQKALNSPLKIIHRPQPQHDLAVVEVSIDKIIKQLHWRPQKHLLQEIKHVFKQTLRQTKNI